MNVVEVVTASRVFASALHMRVDVSVWAGPSGWNSIRYYGNGLGVVTSACISA